MNETKPFSRRSRRIRKKKSNESPRNKDGKRSTESKPFPSRKQQDANTRSKKRSTSHTRRERKGIKEQMIGRNKTKNKNVHSMDNRSSNTTNRASLDRRRNNRSSSVANNHLKLHRPVLRVPALGVVRESRNTQRSVRYELERDEISKDEVQTRKVQGGKN